MNELCVRPTGRPPTVGIADPAIPLLGGRGCGQCEENRRAWQLTKQRLHSGQALLPTTTTTLLCSVLCPRLPLFLEGPFLKLQAYLVQMRKLRPRTVKITPRRLPRSLDYQGQIHTSPIRILYNHILLALDPAHPILWPLFCTHFTHDSQAAA